MVYTKNALAGDWEWQYRVFRYRLADPAPEFLRSARGAGGLPAFPWARQTGGVLVAEGVEQEDPHKPTRTYDPTAETEALVTAATRFDPMDTDEMLRFVNEWGLLGFVLEPDTDQLWDSVSATQQHLGLVRKLFARLDALKRRRWDDPALPSIAEIRRVLRGIPSRPPTPRERGRIQWQAFSVELDSALRDCAVRFKLIPSRDALGIRQVLQPRRLADVLLITLWQHAADADLVLRNCEACNGVFFVSTTNGKRRFCDHSCKNRAGVRRLRQRQSRRPA